MSAEFITFYRFYGDIVDVQLNLQQQNLKTMLPVAITLIVFRSPGKILGEHFLN